MKKMLFILLVSVLLTSCEECVLLEEVIGEVREPEETCPPYYGLFFNGQANDIPDFRSLINPITKPNSFSPIDADVSGYQPNSNFRPDFSAFNKNENLYTYSFYNEDGDETSFVYFFDITNNRKRTLEANKQVVAPVFSDNELWAINIKPITESRGDLEIFKLDANIGIATFTFKDKYNVAGLMNDVYVSSAADINGNIYFVSDNQLISYDIDRNRMTIRTLGDNTNPDLRYSFYGLEYDEQNNRLLALRTVMNSQTPNAELVEISLSTFEPRILLSVSDKYASQLSSFDALLYRSTTYDSCDQTYTISELKSPETNQGNVFIKIRLDDLSVSTSNSEGYYLGLEAGK